MLLFNNARVFIENSLQGVEVIRENIPNFLHSSQEKIPSKSRDYIIRNIRIQGYSPIFS
jgi:hypothetical protein